MPLGLGPRFLVEAAFLVAVAVAAAVLELSTPAIVAVMGAAWLLVAAIEWGLSRRAAARERAATLLPTSETVRVPIAPPLAEPEPEVEPEPLREPIPPEPVVARAAVEPEEAPLEAVPPPLPEPIAPAVEERVELVAVPDLEPEPEFEPEREAEPEPEPVRASVVHLDVQNREPREWNLWDLERAVRDASGEDAERDEERSFLLMYLRDFAGPDGSLPTSFDALVRDSFGDLLETRAV